MWEYLSVEYVVTMLMGFLVALELFLQTMFIEIQWKGCIQFLFFISSICIQGFQKVFKKHSILNTNIKTKLTSDSDSPSSITFGQVCYKVFIQQIFSMAVHSLITNEHTNEWTYLAQRITLLTVEGIIIRKKLSSDLNSPCKNTFDQLF